VPVKVRPVLQQAREMMSVFADMEELIRLGAYRKGSDPQVDRAIALNPQSEASHFNRAVLLGELGLDGRLRPVAGTLAMAEAAGREGLQALVVAPENAGEAALAGSLHMASGSALADGAERPTPIAPWLLGLALACALTELVLRRSGDGRTA